jgi:hypothetical protein
MTELVSVERVGEGASGCVVSGRALQVARQICGGEDEARRLVAAAAVVAAAGS